MVCVRINTGCQKIKCKNIKGGLAVTYGTFLNGNPCPETLLKRVTECENFVVGEVPSRRGQVSDDTPTTCPHLVPDPSPSTIFLRSVTRYRSVSGQMLPFKQCSLSEGQSTLNFFPINFLTP